GSTMKSLRPGADARPVWPPPKRSSIWLATTRPAGCRRYDSIESNTATSVNPRFQDSSVFQKPEAHGRYQAERAQRRAGSQPARRARQRKPFCSVGVADGGRQDACPTLRFMESRHSLLRMHWDHEPRLNGRCRASVLDCGSPLPLLRPRAGCESARGLAQSKISRCDGRFMESWADRELNLACPMVSRVNGEKHTLRRAETML